MIDRYDIRDLYRKMVEESEDGMMVCDREGRILLVNNSSAKDMGLPKEEIIGKLPEELVGEGVYKNSTVMDAIRTGKTVTGIVVVRGKNHLSTSIPLYNENGEMEIVITNNRTNRILDVYADLLSREKDRRSISQHIVSYLSAYNRGNLVYESQVMAEIIERCRSFGETEGTIMILGETGVGKEEIAKMIHSVSARSAQPMIPVNCSAIPTELFESEFFGYQPNAFTGASSKGKIGLVKMADQGTLFLDELGDMPLPMQVKLLRFLESGEFTPVGGSKPEISNVRIVSATSRNLRKMVAEGLFREELYYRLSVLPVHVPPLRERPEDIIPISRYYIDHFNQKYSRHLVLENYDYYLLQCYSWPGNVRELRNSLERTVILNDLRKSRKTIMSLIHAEKQGVRSDSDLKETAAGTEVQGALSTYQGLSLSEAKARFERDFIQTVIDSCGGRLQEAAGQLGMHRSTLYRKMHS